MIDQCRSCELRGNLEGCKATECFYHENWYAVEQQIIINKLKGKLRFLEPFVSHAKEQLDLPEGFTKIVDDKFWDLI